MLLVRCPERELGRGHGRHALAADGRPGRFTVGTGGEGGKRVTEGGQAREERDVKAQRWP